ncbi:glutamate receptor ionotropic, delta-1 [Caerostris extrusa]|uniref:Glutamate receptor ionotropic, delta-1 n=1 Tax=Caerostris extrusa TaxID=172846 RepID=A0AAV4TSD1_CAEEX|nr:glutamate receptor ionotropic, delta-1 [Caerostris extrusa]
MGREDTFVASVVWNVVLAAKQIWDRENQDSMGRCAYFNGTHDISFASIVTNKMSEDGILSNYLKYELLRNVPVSPSEEIFRPIATWYSVHYPNRFSYLEKDIETKLIFNNRLIKLAMPYNPPYTFPTNVDENTVNPAAAMKLLST